MTKHRVLGFKSTTRRCTANRGLPIPSTKRDEKTLSSSLNEQTEKTAGANILSRETSAEPHKTISRKFPHKFCSRIFDYRWLGRFFFFSYRRLPHSALTTPPSSPYLHLLTRVLEATSRTSCGLHFRRPPNAWSTAAIQSVRARCQCVMRVCWLCQ